MVEENESNEIQGQEAITVSAEMLLAQIVNSVGEEFVIIPTDGWMMIVKTIQKYTEDAMSEEGTKENLLKNLEGLGIPVVPVSLAPKEEESRIIMPNDIPAGDSTIITP